MIGYTRGPGRDVRFVSDRMAEPASTSVEVRAYPRLLWRQSRRSFPLGHPRTLRRVLDTRPDNRDDISFVRARGGHGTFFLNWLVRGCFVAKKRCPGELFARKIGRERTNKRVSPVPLPEFEEFSSR